MVDLMNMLYYRNILCIAFPVMIRQQTLLSLTFNEYANKYVVNMNYEIELMSYSMIRITFDIYKYLNESKKSYDFCLEKTNKSNNFLSLLCH